MASVVPASVSGKKVAWEVDLCSCCKAGPLCCLASFCGCHWCVLGSALAHMERGHCSECVFHSICTGLLNSVFARTYMREAFQIRGSPGWDCCTSVCCLCCNAAQLYAHVHKAGPPVTLPQVSNQLGSANFGGCPDNWREAACLDPVNMLCVSCVRSCTSASHLQSATGLPFWLGFCFSNYCLNHHVIRVNYGLPGNAIWNDCIEPSICAAIDQVPFVGSFITCIYFVQMLQNERLVIKKSAEIHAPSLFMNRAVCIELPPAVPGVVIEQQPGADIKP